MIRIVHVITSLAAGGAEGMLYRLLQSMDPGAFRNEVISLSGEGEFGPRIRQLGIPVTALRLKTRGPAALWSLARQLRRSRPDIVQSWMYHANLIGGVAARLMGQRVVWNIRRGELQPEIDRRATVWTSRLCAAISEWLPERIIFCSAWSAEAHAACGYARGRMSVIPDGFDPGQFKPDVAARAALRAEWGLSASDVAVGIVARYHPAKDHGNFIRAARLIRRQAPEVHFVLCGAGASRENHDLVRQIGDPGLLSRCHFLGIRRDVPRVMAALDIAVSSSRTEAFPNVIGEAMATGIPCVATNVGDTALLVGDCGRIVPPRDAERLAEAVGELVRLAPQARVDLGAAARRRVAQLFDIHAIAARYEEVYRELVACDVPGLAA
jgi:glycosyltransferase involved in cell wall biosynthesis